MMRTSISSAPEEQLIENLRKHVRFPEHISNATICADPVIISDFTKTIILWEHSMSQEEHIEEAREQKMSKYQ